jgi:hypothetical protein
MCSGQFRIVNANSESNNRNSGHASEGISSQVDTENDHEEIVSPAS